MGLHNGSRLPELERGGGEERKGSKGVERNKGKETVKGGKGRDLQERDGKEFVREKEME